MGRETPLPTTDYSQHPPPHRAGWRFSLGAVLRILAGASGVVAVAAYVHGLHSDWPEYYASGARFAATTLLSALLGYLVFRCFFGRFTGLFAGMAFAGAASYFLWRKGDDLQEFAILGMCVACSLFIAVGWIDRRRMPYLKRTGLSREPGGTR